ncbi:hypothetical protein LAZ67_11001630 [Cordylochernes scorpioides]|uniref:Mos1 transposase HTH domain-containing protein n=1 Tax=Cordylochernes scorpioides TaxID=51811 RepID=A0ABY6L0W0_9ARAC|nr:hypothetical protein LAZ67_11001630 [Cordylochernes scorpioides]
MVAPWKLKRYGIGLTEMEDQRICIKFCVKNGFKGAEIFWMLQTAYGKAVMSRRRVFEWYKRFKEGREETADNERSGRPSTSTTPEKVDKVLELVHEDRRITVRVPNWPPATSYRRDKVESKKAMKAIPKTDYQRCFADWKKRVPTFFGCCKRPTGRRVFEWYKRFKEGREETADNERFGIPSTSTTPPKVDKVLELVHEDRRITVREVAEEAGISSSIMKDILRVRRLNAVLVSKDLTFDLKNARKETASLNLEATTDDPELLKRVITGNETWIYGFDLETTQQTSEWRFKNEPRPKKARKAPSKVKVLLTVFFDYQGIFHHEFQQQGSTITADSYLGVLRRLREAIRRKRPELWRSKSWILHHDNSPAHTALKSRSSCGTTQPLCSSNPPTIPI